MMNDAILPGANSAESGSDIGTRNSSGQVRDAGRIALVVLGMHRSGTSAMAGLLSHMGCDLPRALMPPTEANPKGYFESVKAYQLNDALLASAGSSWDDPAVFNLDWYNSPRYPEYRARALRVVEEEFGESGFFVLKDPRVCRLLPFWQDVLAAAGVTPNYVCTHRHPREVAASLARREGWPETTGLILWLRHVLEAEAGTRGAPRVFVSYDALMSDWRQTVVSIGEGLDLRWPVPLDRAAASADAFLSGELRHFAAAGGDLPQSSMTFDWVSAVYGILERWVAGEGRATDHAQLDAIKAAFDASFPALGNLVRESRDLSTKVTRIEAQVTALRAESISNATNHATEQQNRGKAEARLAEAGRNLEHLAGLKLELEQYAKQLNEQVMAQGHELNELRGKGEGDQSKILQLVSDLEAARARAAIAERRLAELEEQYEDTAKLKRAAEDALAQMKSAFLQRGHELDELRRQTESDAGTIAALGRDLEAAQRDLDALEKRHERDAKHLAQMARQLAPLLRQELGTMLESASSAERAMRLEAELQSLRSALESQRQSIEGKDLDVERLQAEVNTLQDELVSVRLVQEAERRQAEAKDIDHEAERTKLDAAKTQLGAEVNTLRDELDSLRSTYEADRQWAQTRDVNFEIERTRLNAAKNKLGAEVNALKRELGAVRAAYEEERVLAGKKEADGKDHERLAEETARRQMEEEFDRLKNELETSRTEREVERLDLERKAAELESYKQAIASSTSWRMTAPLRGLSRLVRGVRHPR